MCSIQSKFSPLLAAAVLAAGSILSLAACSDEDPATAPANSRGGMGSGGIPMAKGGSPPSLTLMGGSTAAGGSIASVGGTSSGGSTGTGSGGSLGSTGGSSDGGSAGSGGSSEAGAPGSGGSSAGGSTFTDAKVLVKTGNPGNAKLEAYADNEIGTPSIGTEGSGGNRTITGPIVVPPGVLYDGKGETLTAEGMGDGSQNEGQQPLFILMPGAGVKNVTINKPGCEGIHMMGNNTLENIVWKDVGEDAASVRSYFPGGYIYIEGGSANSADDKTFQFNAPSKIIIKNFKATNISKLVRQGDLLANQPGGAVPIDIVLDGVSASNVKTALVMCNEPNCTLMTRDVSGSPLTNGTVTKLEWKAGASDRPVP